MWQSSNLNFPSRLATLMLQVNIIISRDGEDLDFPHAAYRYDFFLITLAPLRWHCQCPGLQWLQCYKIINSDLLGIKSNSQWHVSRASGPLGDMFANGFAIRSQTGHRTVREMFANQTVNVSPSGSDVLHVSGHSSKRTRLVLQATIL